MSTMQDERSELRKRALAVLRAKKNKRHGKVESESDMWARMYKHFEGRSPEDLSAQFKCIMAGDLIRNTNWEEWTSAPEKFQRLLTFLIDIKGSSEEERALLCFGCGVVNINGVNDVEFPNNCFVNGTNALVAFHSPECLKKHWKARRSFIKWIQI